MKNLKIALFTILAVAGISNIQAATDNFGDSVGNIVTLGGVNRSEKRKNNSKLSHPADEDKRGSFWNSIGNVATLGAVNRSERNNNSKRKDSSKRKKNVHVQLVADDSSFFVPKQYEISTPKEYAISTPKQYLYVSKQ